MKKPNTNKKNGLPKTNLKKVGKNLGKVVGKGTQHVTEVHKTKAGKWLLFILLTFLTTLLISYRTSKIPSEIKVGEIAPYDIKADRDYEILDEEATAKFRAEALQNIKPTYTFDSYLGVGIAERISAAFEEIRRLARGYFSEAGKSIEEEIPFNQLNDKQISELRKTWNDMLGVETGDKEWKYLLNSGFSTQAENQITELIISFMSHPIAGNKEQMLENEEKGIAVRKLPPAGENESIEEESWGIEEIKEIPTLEEMRQDIIKGKYVPESFNITEYDDRMPIRIAVSLLQPNVVYDAQLTETRRQNVLKDIKNVVINIQSGESIIRGGSRFEPWHIKVIEGIRREKRESSLPLEMVGSFILIFTIYLVVYLFGQRYIRKFAPSKVDLVFMGSLMLVMLILLRVALFLASAIHGISAADIPKMALSYMIPIAAGAMLVRFIINSDTAALFAIVLAAFAGLVVQGNVYFTSFTLMSSLVAAVAISHADKRSAILQAGIITGLINAIMVLSIHLINAASVVEPLSLNSLMWYEIAAFVNGIGCSVFILVMAPLSESVFGYTTDIKLLELANLNHPLLRELIIRAPGTYHHSHLVGILAETAAEAVDANPLLARVGAYYHDIGKMKKPQYFTENLAEGGTAHNALSPHMSALIVSSHVKDGLELAKMYKLPQIIASMIPQHHGTRKISFFYEKAKGSTDPSLQKIEEKDFRYPGPKPQTKEAAILMLADGSEAAVRSLKDKTMPRIQQVVESIIDKSFTEGQLDDCELTLKDLNEIGKAFTRILTSIYHQRVEYPKETLERGKDKVSVFEEEKEVEGRSSSSSSNKENS